MIAALLLAAAQLAQAQGFPCRFDALPSRPPIVLIGENHCDDGSRAVKRQAWKLAAAGALAVGQEGLYPGDENVLFADAGLTPTPSSALFGIEQPFSHGLVLSYFAGESGKVCEVTDDDAEYSAVAGISRNQALRYAWKLALDDQGGRDLLRTSHAARLLDHGARGFPVTREQFKALSPQDFDELLRLMRVVNNFYVKAANEELDALGLQQPLTPLPIELHKPPLPQEQAQLDAAERSVDPVILPVRNRMMSANLESAYCAAASTGRALVAVVGSAHLPGMMAILARDSGGQVSLSTLDSERDAQRAMDALASLAARRAPPRTIGAAPSLATPDWR